MNEFSAIAVVVAGFAVRLAIPILITLLVVHFLRRLDVRWQAEAQNVSAPVEKPACWEIKECPPERRDECLGYTSPLPCWQARRMPNGYLREECLGCKIFLETPAPMLG